MFDEQVFTEHVFSKLYRHFAAVNMLTVRMTNGRNQAVVGGIKAHMHPGKMYINV